MLKPLKDIARIPEHPVTGVLYASSLLPHKRVYEHNAFYDPNGKIGQAKMASELATFAPPAHPLSNTGITNPAVLKAWYHIACGEWTALPQVVAQSKKTGEVGEQAKLLLERADAYLAARSEAFDKRTIDLAAHLEGSDLVEHLAYSPTHKAASKELAEKLKAAAKEAPLKAELTARSTYFKLVPMQLSPKKSENEAAKAGYQQLASKFADTAYGRKAQVALDAMSAVASN